MLTKADLIAFETVVKAKFEAGEVHGPVHLSNGNEAQLIEIFRDVNPGDWVFSTWRSHYHALLKGIPMEWLLAEIIKGHSMHINSVEHRFMASSIVGGCLPIAVGVAAAVKRQGGYERVWCFVGDMAASCGMFHDCAQYAVGFDLPITFVIEDNGKSTNTPTAETWGSKDPVFYGRLATHVLRYKYESAFPHIGAGKRTTM